MRLLRVLVSAVGISVAAVGATAAYEATAAADTTAMEFYVGQSLTASRDHSLVGRTVIKKGSVAKVMKVHTSNSGNVTKLDVKLGDVDVKNVPVARIRENYDYAKH